jgi:hypothetical protein
MRIPRPAEPTPAPSSSDRRQPGERAPRDITNLVLQPAPKVPGNERRPSPTANAVHCRDSSRFDRSQEASEARALLLLSVAGATLPTVRRSQSPCGEAHRKGAAQACPLHSRRRHQDFRGSMIEPASASGQRGHRKTEVEGQVFSLYANSTQEHPTTGSATLNNKLWLWRTEYLQRHQRVAVAMSTIAELQGSADRHGQNHKHAAQVHTRRDE